MEKEVNSIGISVQGFIALRKEPFEWSEMVSQVLFGETVKIISEEARWLQVRCISDGYEGWLDRKCIHKIDSVPSCENISISTHIKVKNISKNTYILLPAGSIFPILENDSFTIADKKFRFEEHKGFGKPGSFSSEEIIEQIISIPYLWGGKCGFGFDCSGLSQYYCKAMGIAIPRDAREQAKLGITLSFTSEAKIGDLAFFDDEEGLIHHVGIVLDNSNILHASGTVRIDKLDQQGIYNEELGRYTHKLRIIKQLSRLRKD